MGIRFTKVVTCLLVFMLVASILEISVLPAWEIHFRVSPPQQKIVFLYFFHLEQRSQKQRGAESEKWKEE